VIRLRGGLCAQHRAADVGPVPEPVQPVPADGDAVRHDLAVRCTWSGVLVVAEEAAAVAKTARQCQTTVTYTQAPCNRDEAGSSGKPVHKVYNECTVKCSTCLEQVHDALNHKPYSLSEVNPSLRVCACSTHLWMSSPLSPIPTIWPCPMIPAFHRGLVGPNVSPSVSAIPPGMPAVYPP